MKKLSSNDSAQYLDRWPHMKTDKQRIHNLCGNETAPFLDKLPNRKTKDVKDQISSCSFSKISSSSFSKIIFRKYLCYKDLIFRCMSS